MGWSEGKALFERREAGPQNLYACPFFIKGMHNVISK
jgi:hypothetical protein